MGNISFGFEFPTSSLRIWIRDFWSTKDIEYLYTDLYFYILLYKEKKPSIFTAAINIKHAVCIIDGDDNLVN